MVYFPFVPSFSVREGTRVSFFELVFDNSTRLNKDAPSLADQFLHDLTGQRCDGGDRFALVVTLCSCD
jgi:hypothetical protein